MNITNGGTVKLGTLIYLGQLAGSTGIVNVDGANSQWIASGTLDVGSAGNGTLNVSGGAAVRRPASDWQQHLAAEHRRWTRQFARHGRWGADEQRHGANTGGGRCGSRHLYAHRHGNWSGSGAYQAVGGTCNAGTHVFTVASAFPERPARPSRLPPASAVQRVLISDGAAGTSFGVGFLSSESALHRYRLVPDRHAAVGRSQAVWPPASRFWTAGNFPPRAITPPAIPPIFRCPWGPGTAPIRAPI